jgi:glycosyltransferase involved in cell wall biosynthesis
VRTRIRTLPPMTRTVCFFTDSTAFGGAEQSLLTLIAGLDPVRWRPVLAFHDTPGAALLARRAEELATDLWPVQKMPEGVQGAVRVGSFAAALRRRRPDIFHAHLTWQVACKYGLAGAVVARVPGVVATYQLLVDAHVTRPSILQQRVLARGVGRAIVVSRELATYLRERFGWRPEKIRLIHNAVPFGEPPSPDPARRAELSPDGKPIVLTPARLDPLKGHRFLLEAARSLPDARFVFAGDGPERGALERMSADLAISSRVTFLGHRGDVSELLACADVVVLPSLAEGLPLAVLEAMAARRAVVATAVGDVTDAIRTGETGIVVEPGNSAALATAIHSVLADRELAARLGNAAAAHGRQHFAAAEMIARVTGVYDELLDDGLGRRHQ